MTNRISHTRFGWFVAFTFVLALLANAGSAADFPAETQVALRPVGTTTPPASAPTNWNNSGYPTDLFRPDLLHGPPATPPANDRQNSITYRYQDSRMLGFLQKTNMN